jgi:hypothetical protein
MNIILFFPKNKFTCHFKRCKWHQFQVKRVLLLLLLLFWVWKIEIWKKRKKRVLIIGLNFASLFTSIPCEPSCYWHCSSISSHAMVDIQSFLMIFGCKIRILKLTTNWVGLGKNKNKIKINPSLTMRQG